MNRRTLIQGTGLALLGGGARGSAMMQAAASVAGDEPVGVRLDAAMIWVKDAEAVPAIATGVPSIATDGNGRQQEALEDLHAVFWRAVEMPEGVRKAEMHLFAYTRYRLYLNGRYVGRGPSRFQNQRPEYDTWDVSEFVRAGQNTVAVLVHRDFHSGRVMDHLPGFTAELSWVGQDGQERRVATDESWRGVTERSFLARKQAWASIPENIDATQMEDWTGAEFDGSTWPAAVRVSADASFYPLWPRTTPLQRVQERRLEPMLSDAGRVLAAGDQVNLAAEEVMQAFHVLRFEAERGSVLEVKYLLPGGESSGMGSYTAREGMQTWMGGDTFALNGLQLAVKQGRVTLRQAQVFEVRYPFTRVGRFASGDAMLDRLWGICARSLEVLSEDSYVDCADRERVEWTDDTPPAFECTRVMMAGPDSQGRPTIWGDPRLVKALALRVVLTQRPDGQVKAHTCSERMDIHGIMEDRSCDWVNVVRQYYDSTWDKDFVRRMWPAMMRLMEWFLGRRTERGLVQAREWEVWGNPMRYQVCEGAGLNALFYGALQDAAYLGTALGPAAQQDAARLAAAADALRGAFEQVLWNETAGAYSGGFFGPGTKMDPAHNRGILQETLVEERFRPTLQANLFALESGIVPETKRRRVEEWAIAHQAEATDVMSYFYLWKVLYRADRPELDVQVLQQMREKWKPQVESPWQTTWEMLGGPEGHGSKVHIYGMTPGYFLSAFVLGVRREGAVWERRMVVEPRCGDLQQAEGVVVTEWGPVPVAWNRDEKGGMRLTVTVPEDVKAEVRLRRLAGASELMLDGARVSASLQGGWAVVSVTAGRHTILQRGQG